MNTIEAILIAFGESQTVLDLTDKLTGTVQQRLAVGETSPATSDPVTSNSVIIKLPTSADDDLSALADVESWLIKHRRTIDGAVCSKTIQFSIFLDSNTGSRILTVPNSIVRTCGHMDVDIAVQSIRIPTERELEDLRTQ